MPSASQADVVGKKNILIIVFDAFSARHISTYGYSRETTPNINRLAERAIVYHNHHAGGNFTTPGTASLLTGTLPWVHRAFGYSNQITKGMVDKSIFHAFKDYYRVAYTHNRLAANLLNQFSSGLEENIPLEQFFLNSDFLVEKLFSKDSDIASVSWARSIKKDGGSSYSLCLSALYQRYMENKFMPLKHQFPRGLPKVNKDNYFILETVMNWLGSQVNLFPRPFLGYFHFLPPHDPYGTRWDFVNIFHNDGFSMPWKKEDLFSGGEILYKVATFRQQYDEFILYVDQEFGKLFDHLDELGVLDDTWVVLTSDHGELFERGIIGHVTPVLYEPVIHIPLMIFEPGRKTRTDIFTPTSAIDVLPTLISVTGGQIPEWSEGRVLSPFTSQVMPPDRNIFTLQAKRTKMYEPLTTLTLSLIKDKYKLMYFTGYKELEGRERIELYNLAEDPEELNNLFSAQSGIGKTMLDELKSKLSEMNKPYL